MGLPGLSGGTEVKWVRNLQILLMRVPISLVHFAGRLV